MDPIVVMRRKLRASGLKTATIIAKCEDVDRNNDGCIHKDDFEDILRTLLKEDMFSRRELEYLYNEISNCTIGASRDKKGNGTIDYLLLSDILSVTTPINSRKTQDERWYDDEGDIARNKHQIIQQNEKWACTHGSVGEWLLKAACPAEVKNFKKFIKCLERYERETGLRIALQPSGDFSVPLGPDLKAQITFSTDH